MLHLALRLRRYRDHHVSRPGCRFDGLAVFGQRLYRTGTATEWLPVQRRESRLHAGIGEHQRAGTNGDTIEHADRYSNPDKISDIVSHADQNADVDTDEHRAANAYPHPDADRKCHADRFGDQHPDHHANAVDHADANGNTLAKRDGDSYVNADPNANADDNGDADAITHPVVYRDTDTNCPRHHQRRG